MEESDNQENILKQPIKEEETEWGILIERNFDPNQQPGNFAPKAASNSNIILFFGS